VFWDFEEEYDFTAPTQVIAMDAADGGNRANSRYMRGPLGAHTFRTPGTYRIRVAVLEPATGSWGQGTTTVEVRDPDTFFAGSATLFVDRTGAYTNAPAGARRFTSLSGALSTLASASTPHRIVLENGQTHTMTSAFGIYEPRGASGTCMRIEARAKTGPRPVIALSGGNFAGSSFNERFIVDRQREGSPSATHGTVFQYIEVRGEWDTRTETGNTGVFYNNEGPQTGSTHVVADQCVVSGLWTFIVQTDFNDNAGVSDGSDSGIMLCLSDNRITDWADYGFFSGARARHVFLGNRIAQNVDAQGGGPKTDPPDNTRHGPLRISRPDTDIVASNDLFSCTGWAPWGALHGQQAALRWGTGPNLPGMRLNMQNNALETPWTALLLIPASSSVGRQLSNAVVEGNLMVSGFQARASIECAHGGLTLRNNICIHPDIPLDSRSFGGLNSGIQSNSFVWLSGGSSGGNPNNNSTPIRIYNNTFVNLTRDNFGGNIVTNTIGFSNVTVRNNIVHEPNLSNTPHAPMTSTVAFTCRYKGYKDDTPISLRTQVAHPPDTACIWTPAPGSPALGAAQSEPNASTDFRGNLRPEPPAVGACETD
jgi:hypothetical protein